MKRVNGLVGVFCALVLVGCASTPSWEGLSESDIAAWKSAGFTVESADLWRDYNFSAVEAQSWSQQGFDPEEAAEWSKESFSADEASRWKGAEFDLDTAIEERAKGLAPIESQ
ncbi:hypothetical protein [Aestuariirhabdus litorea]|uniref:Uncharacterized protein n=1 Tax=Aestuariirhabdus litorea TaxID=2528527 RepID=A0A3P3VMA6_9GAMM|nr:hypothetical protein [Aestuariirhabdus litorea]RRJ82796.1 hypothetical protein D0544_13155 [Aestuariirhabdus litorea]RWW92955.1 hypothetical protein DZC74_13130 [Endozoicomonadaceae bacterium GTF-13]